jgi:hypothetical protein
MSPQTILLAILSFVPSARAESLVGRLGGPSYAAREQVGRELVQLGRYALPYLRRGAQSPDLEIAERCKRLLPLAEVEAVRQRVAHLLAKSSAPPPDDLPRLRRFLRVTGDTREARELYVEMFVAHVRVLEDVEQAGDRAGEVFWKDVDKRYQRPDDDLSVVDLRLPPPRVAVSRADVALFLLLSADPDLKPHKSVAVRLTDFPIFTAEAARESLAGAKASDAMRRLLFAWLNGPRNIEWPGAEATRVQQAFKLLADAQVQDGRPVARQIALDPNQWHVARAAALLALMRIGDRTDVARLCALIPDQTTIGAGRHGHVLFGDVALAACLVLSGESAEKYGFGVASQSLQAGSAGAIDLGFEEPLRRDAARKKWNERSARNPPPGDKR